MNWEILYKYVQGSCDKEDLRKLGEWLQEDPANEDFFTSFIEGWNEKDKIEFNSDDQAAWDEFKKNNSMDGTANEDPSNFSDLLDVSVKKTQHVTQRNKRGTAYWMYSLAAVVLLLIVVIVVVRQHTMLNSSSQEKTIQYQEISTVKGQRSNLKLSDGTAVVLNSSSTLRIPLDYGNRNRTLYLEGEAFFKVTHDEANPFVVISDQIYTKDLGTQFNITAYEPGSVEVAVKEGLVSIGKMAEGNMQDEIVEITPHKLGILKEIGGLTVSDIENMDQYVGWTEGKLVFQRTPFPEVVKRLERWFDIECEVETVSPDLSERTLTATYNNMPMSEVLQVMAISMKLSYGREGRTITFKDAGMKHALEDEDT